MTSLKDGLSVSIDMYVLFIVRLQEVILDLADPKYVSVSAYERCPLMGS